MNGTTLSTLSRNNFNQLLNSSEDTKRMITFEEVSPSTHTHQRGNYLIYNNQLYKVTASIAIGDALSISTNLEAVNVGTELKATSGGGSAGGEVITPPTLTSGTSFICDSTIKSLSFSELDEETMVIGGASNINAGSYIAAIALMNGNNIWSDTLDNVPKTYPWEITRAQATLSVNSTSVTLDNNTLSAELTITKTGDGTLSAVSSDTDICSVTLNGTSLTITRTNPVFSYATVTVSLSDTSNYIAPSDVIIDVSVYGTIVSWASGTDAQIVTMVEGADLGLIDLYDDAGWRVGDTRTVHLSAMSATGVGETHVEQDVEFVLMHRKASGIGLSPSTPSGRSQCSFVVGMKNVLANGTTAENGQIHNETTNEPAWVGCQRQTWCNEIFREAIPASLRSIFKQFTRLVPPSGGESSTVLSAKDYFALPTEKNVFGQKIYGTKTETYYGEQWEWYQTAANRIKKAGKNGSATAWWEGAPTYNYTGYWCSVSSTGNSSYSAKWSSLGISPFGVI